MSKLPQIPRFITAANFRLFPYIMLWGLLLAWLGINLQAVILNSQVNNNLIFSAISNSNDRTVHLKLARIFFDNGQIPQVNNKLKLADTSRNILGVSTGNSTLLGTWQSEPLTLQHEYEYWLKLTENKPDYRDAYIMAAIMAYQMKYSPEAIKLIQTALSLDPNYPPAIMLDKLISQPS